MPKPVKVFNKGIRPVVFKRDLKGVEAIHPGKFFWFNPAVANKIVRKFDDACLEDDYKKHLEEVAKKVEADRKESENGKKKTKTPGK